MSGISSDGRKSEDSIPETTSSMRAESPEFEPPDGNSSTIQLLPIFNPPQDLTEAKTPETAPLLALNSSQPGFGQISNLSPWFPQLDPDHPKAKNWRWYLSRRPRIMSIQLATTITVFTLNLSLTIWAVRRYDIVHGIGVILIDDCGKVRALGVALHLVINILGTAIFGASNFCMQILVAPTRQDLDRAHKARQWLDIGIPSLRNLTKIARSRVLVWTLLALSSVPLHLLWNSAIFSSFPYVNYRIAIVTADFAVNDKPWSSSATDFYQLGYQDARQLQSDGKHFSKLNLTECIERYMDPLSGAGDLVVVTSEQNNSISGYDGSSLLRSFQASGSGDWHTMMKWICGANAYNEFYCTLPNILPYAESWVVIVGDHDVPVEYCLSQGVHDMSQWCSLNFSSTIMVIVCVLNFVKVFGILFTMIISLRGQKQESSQDQSYHEPLVTVGDAIQSFLIRPDPSTEQMCLASSRDLDKNEGWTNSRRQWLGTMHVPKFHLASLRSWVFTLTSAIIVISIVAFLLATSIHTLGRSGLGTDLSSLWGQGLGQVGMPYVVQIFDNSRPDQADLHFWGSIFFANSWQVLISLLYLLYNTVLSQVCVSLEWSHYGHGSRSFLRTSSPRGMQRSTYFLSLPFRYSVPLCISAALLHWFISQSVFLAQSTAYSSDTIRQRNGDSSQVCFSALGMMWSLSIGVILILGLIFIGMQKITFHLPVAVTSSAAISAACHPSVGDRDASLLPLRWGVVPGEKTDEAGHCSFNTHAETCTPVKGEYYQ